jgi:hypothetical protein
VAIERLLLGAAWADAGATATDGVSISTLLNFRTPLKPYRSQLETLLKTPVDLCCRWTAKSPCLRSVRRWWTAL